MRLCAVFKMRGLAVQRLLFFFFRLPPGSLSILQFDDVDAQRNFEHVRYYLAEATFLLLFDLLLSLPLHLLS